MARKRALLRRRVRNNFVASRRGRGDVDDGGGNDGAEKQQTTKNDGCQVSQQENTRDDTPALARARVRLASCASPRTYARRAQKRRFPISSQPQLRGQKRYARHRAASSSVVELFPFLRLPFFPIYLVPINDAGSRFRSTARRSSAPCNSIIGPPRNGGGPFLADRGIPAFTAAWRRGVRRCHGDRRSATPPPSRPSSVCTSRLELTPPSSQQARFTSRWSPVMWRRLQLPNPRRRINYAPPSLAR